MLNASLNRVFPISLIIVVAALSTMVLVEAPGFSNHSGLTASSPIGRQGPASGSQTAPTAISEKEAQGLIWALPEVQACASYLRQYGVQPVTITMSTPSPSAQPGTAAADYVIRLAEDHGSYTVPVDTFAVDAYTEQIYVYDVNSDKMVPLQEWRSSR